MGTINITEIPLLAKQMTCNEDKAVSTGAFKKGQSG